MGTQNGHNVPFLESASLEKKKKDRVKVCTVSFLAQIRNPTIICDNLHRFDLTDTFQTSPL